MVSVFEDLGFDGESIGKIVVRCPEIFATRVETTLKRKLEFIKSIGISEEHLPRVIKKYPEVLVSDVDKTVLPRYGFFHWLCFISLLILFLLILGIVTRNVLAFRFFLGKVSLLNSVRR